MDRIAALIATIAVGALVALQPPANASLAGRVGNVGAAFVSLTISVAIAGAILLLSGGAGRLSGLSAFRLQDAIGGVAGVAVVTVSLITVRPLGVGGVTAALVAAQLVASLIVDRLGILGLRETAITPGRLIGAALVIGGTVLITRS